MKKTLLFLLSFSFCCFGCGVGADQHNLANHSDSLIADTTSLISSAVDSAQVNGRSNILASPKTKMSAKRKKRKKINAKQSFVTEPSYTSSSYSSFCGAPTKRGGSCSRRVAGGGRCWQH